MAKAVVKLSREEAERELARLAAEIAEQDRRYHELDAPAISDADYDALRRRNDEIEQAFPDLIRADSPSRRVGSQASGKFSKVRHRVPMLSLENGFSEDDVTAFLDRVRRFLNLPADAPQRALIEAKLADLNAPAVTDDPMVRGMVDRLAERLAAEPQDLDGWLLLVTSYVKLGERDKALAALAKAREIFKDDAAALEALAAKAKELGLEP